MKISKVVRRNTGAGSTINAVIATNVNESDSETIARGRQDVEIVQRDGHTEVRERHTDDLAP